MKRMNHTVPCFIHFSTLWFLFVSCLLFHLSVKQMRNVIRNKNDNDWLYWGGRGRSVFSDTINVIRSYFRNRFPRFKHTQWSTALFYGAFWLNYLSDYSSIFSRYAVVIVDQYSFLHYFLKMCRTHERNKKNYGKWEIYILCWLVFILSLFSAFSP